MDSFFSKALISWYQEHQRFLPWRCTSDPYAIWISEIILQQTRVAQGLDYYNRFMARFPDVETLAQASEDEVLLYWQGLGYYSRARNLHFAAHQIVEQDGFPKTYEGVRALKGVGDYTAAAISSIAYGLPYAVVDGNVYRVLSRVFGVDIPIDSTQGKKYFAQLAQELVDVDSPGLYNQSIMDFGALQCVPKSPNCDTCPLQDRCVAHAQHKVDALPVKSHKTKVTHRYFHYLNVRIGDEMLLHQRKADDIWKNLYEVPLVEADHRMSVDELTQTTLFRQLACNQIQLVKEQLKHVLSHRVIFADLYILSASQWPSPLPAGYFKLKASDLGNYAISRLMDIILQEK
ncbi:MAG: A/G-specific adenine glycosylase [Bacteroidaceae bacterium]|nr:A/G-specific adenine glycosylase [Bacteroidaceae bacterium]